MIGASGTLRLLVTFQFTKRIPANFKIFTYTLKYLYDTPFILKNNHIKKDPYKFNTYITLFIVIIFFKITNTYKKHTYKP